MKQNIWLMMFALWLLLGVSSKQIFALGGSPLAAQDPTPTSPPETAVHMKERINNYRTELGLPAYYQDEKLAQASQWVVDTMVATEFISHYDDTGANPQQRAEAAGYTEHVTEIIYGGVGGADAAWEWWFANELHHGLLISEDYVEFGVATAINPQSGRQYWAVMFGFGDGQYAADDLSNHENEAGVVTKLPSATSTSAVTAVAPTSTAEEPSPTATSAQVALVDTEPTNPTTENSSGTSTNNTSLNSLEESRWLIIAALATIIISIAVFYFPRLGLSQKFKERT
ncbi:MAG: hypothetical protein IAF02_12340 [Anaerolineae bacterium]|nr:hypothetical protein [Anaerolineae bacterium]